MTIHRRFHLLKTILAEAKHPLTAAQIVEHAGGRFQSTAALGQLYRWENDGTIIRFQGPKHRVFYRLADPEAKKHGK